MNFLIILHVTKNAAFALIKQNFKMNRHFPIFVCDSFFGLTAHIKENISKDLYSVQLIYVAFTERFKNNKFG